MQHIQSNMRTLRISLLSSSSATINNALISLVHSGSAQAESLTH